MLKTGSVAKCKTYGVSYQTIQGHQGSVRNYYIFLKNSESLVLCYGTCFRHAELKKGLAVEGSSLRYTGRSFNGSVEIVIAFL
ncbi:unnamed protein product, partial [Adineta ricciae]